MKPIVVDNLYSFDLNLEYFTHKLARFLKFRGGLCFFMYSTIGLRAFDGLS